MSEIAPPSERPCGKRPAPALMNIYFLRNADGDVKIGIARDVRARAHLLSLGDTRRLEVYGWVEVAPEAARRIEHYLHQRYKAHAIGREWFRGLPLKEAVALARGLVALDGEPEPEAVAASDERMRFDSAKLISEAVRAERFS